ncbi:hypothetical protein ISS08_00605 [Candidatus Pacearchaeota archaeon]|nr:hypothetical protein [Candidatus Pacearchaeota archaeon]
MKLIERPGFLGKEKERKYLEWDERFGKDNWELGWKWGNIIIDFEWACKIYEDAYFFDSFNRERLWKKLFSQARDFYDNDKSNVQSRTNYLEQESSSTHIQDISVRRVGIRRGWERDGNELIQIRGPETKGYQLMPGIVKFHIPEMIESPNIVPDWADPLSVEAFYQNNRWLYIKS